jgi:hypothetical protein
MELWIIRARAGEQRLPGERARFETLVCGEWVVDGQKQGQRTAGEEQLRLDAAVAVDGAGVEEPEIELGALQSASLRAGWQVKDLDVEKGSVRVARSQKGLQLLGTKVGRTAHAQRPGREARRHAALTTAVLATDAGVARSFFVYASFPHDPRPATLHHIFG